MPPSVPDQQALPLPPPGASPRRGVSPQSPLRIKQDGKFYERLLTKEASAPGNLSFRYYWADQPGSVPFVWETQPGTPRDVAGMAAGAVPAITPPPAYLLRHGNSKVVAAASHHHHQPGNKRAPKSRKRCRLRRIRIGFIAGIFRRFSLRKTWRRPVEVSSSSRWLFCSPATERGERDHEHNHDHDVSAARQEKPVLCSGVFRARPRPWLLRFRGAR